MSLKAQSGTGPFILEEYVDGERAVLKRREDYWGMGEDGEPLPYLDEVIFVSIDKEAALAGMQSGQVNTMYNPGPAQWQALKDNPGFVTTIAAGTAQTLILRARVDLEPWDDPRVMRALRMCQDRTKILQLSWFGEGDEGTDAHIAPVHPAFPDNEEIPALRPSRRIGHHGRMGS